MGSYDSTKGDKQVIVACIPAYNEERAIGGVVVRAMKYVDRVVVCDDGSGDLTGVIAEGLGAVVVRHERNMGYGASLRSLFAEALRLGADVVVTLDGDGQHDPGEILLLVERLRTGEEYSIALPYKFNSQITVKYEQPLIKSSLKTG